MTPTSSLAQSFLQHIYHQCLKIGHKRVKMHTETCGVGYAQDVLNHRKHDMYFRRQTASYHTNQRIAS